MSQGVECYSCLPKTAWPPTSLVDERHVPVGMLSIRDAIDFLVELIPEEILNLPPAPQQRYVKTPEGD